jgi:hypothetical protein
MGFPVGRDLDFLAGYVVFVSIEGGCVIVAYGVSKMMGTAKLSVAPI